MSTVQGKWYKNIRKNTFLRKCKPSEYVLLLRKLRTNYNEWAIFSNVPVSRMMKTINKRHLLDLYQAILPHQYISGAFFYCLLVPPIETFWKLILLARDLVLPKVAFIKWTLWAKERGFNPNFSTWKSDISRFSLFYLFSGDTQWGRICFQKFGIAKKGK